MKIYRPAILVLGLTFGFMAGALAAADVGPQLGLPANVTAVDAWGSMRIASLSTCDFSPTTCSRGVVPALAAATLPRTTLPSQFALYGLKPAGDNGSYLQKVEFVGVKTCPSTSAALQPAHGTTMDLKLAEDYVAGNQTQTDSVDIERAPSYSWFTASKHPNTIGMTSRGWMSRAKWLLVIVNEPPVEGSEILQCRSADLLRALDVQVRTGGAQGSGRRL